MALAAAVLSQSFTQGPRLAIPRDAGCLTDGQCGFPTRRLSSTSTRYGSSVVMAHGSAVTSTGYLVIRVRLCMRRFVTTPRPLGPVCSLTLVGVYPAGGASCALSFARRGRCICDAHDLTANCTAVLSDRGICTPPCRQAGRQAGRHLLRLYSCTTVPYSYTFSDAQRQSDTAAAGGCKYLGRTILVFRR
jgi:hypothetical protein